MSYDGLVRLSLQNSVLPPAAVRIGELAQLVNFVLSIHSFPRGHLGHQTVGVARGRVVTAVQNNYDWRLGRLMDPYAHHWELGKPLA